MHLGKLIVLEGPDGSGKTTQKERLVSYLSSQNIPHATLSFPRYADSFFGALAGRMLKGDFGESKDIPAHLATLPYACDRWLAKSDITGWLGEGKVVIIDRYTASSAVYQASKVPEAERRAFIDWVYTMEYDIIGLPREDITFYFQIPASLAQTLIEAKGKRAYLGEKKKDIYEASIQMQQTVMSLYESLAARFPTWHTIVCAQGNVVRPPDEIHKDILDALSKKGIF